MKLTMFAFNLLVASVVSGGPAWKEVQRGGGLKIGRKDGRNVSSSRGNGIKIGSSSRGLRSTTTTTTTLLEKDDGIKHLNIGIVVPYKSFGVRDYTKAITTTKSLIARKLKLFKTHDILVHIVMKQMTPSPTGPFTKTELDELASNLNLDESDLEDELVEDDSDGGWNDLDEPEMASTRQIGINQDESSLGVENSDPIYPMSSRTNKWTIRCIYAFFDFSIAASWLQYRQTCRAAGIPKKEINDYLDFKFEIAKSLLFSHRENSSTSNEDTDDPDDEEPPIKKRKVRPTPDKRQRKEGAKHLPEFVSETQKSRSKCRFSGCKGLTFCRCVQCNVFLCCSIQRNCFLKFHQ